MVLWRFGRSNMPSKGRKSEKDGSSKKRKLMTPAEPTGSVPRKKDTMKKSRLSEKGIKSDAKDSLATVTMPRKATKSKKESETKNPDTKSKETDSKSSANQTEKKAPPAATKSVSQPTPTNAKSSSAAAAAAAAADKKNTNATSNEKVKCNDSNSPPTAYTPKPNPPGENHGRGRTPNSSKTATTPKDSLSTKRNSKTELPDAELITSASSKKGRKSNKLNIDTSKIKPGEEKGKSPRPGGTMDAHPYARGSVIEVMHGVEEKSDDEDDWLSDSSEENAEDKSAHSVRLCDVIDRVPKGDKWRYYVHYRDFNRRMDEWISMDRIVSPPSIGNAKARAIKKEKEREQRKKQKMEGKKAEETVDVSAPRASRRRTSTQLPGMLDSSLAMDLDSETPRRTRHSRKKSLDENMGAVSNLNDNAEASAEPGAPVMAAEKGIVALPTQAGTHTTTVGEHIVHTISAQELDEHEGLDDAALREHEEVTKVKNVAFLELGAFQMETWYFSPLPKELLSERGFTEVLYVCEFTFSMFARKSELQRFQARLPAHARHPPGNEIYRNGNLAMFEVDGFVERIYCQNLCYIAKLFLDHKTLYFDVDPFLFYVLCEIDERGFHPVGYYSKEKYSDVGYNLACILTFPCHQRKGYGRFLIAFSYELTKKEEKVGSPEKPMSDLGQQAYKPYWASTVVDFLRNEVPDSSSLSIMDISKMTSIMAEDIVFTLNQLGLLKIINGVYFIAAEEGLLSTLAKKYPVKEPRVDPSCLHWTPYVTDVKRDKFSVHSKKPNLEANENRGRGGF